MKRVLIVLFTSFVSAPTWSLKQRRPSLGGDSWTKNSPDLFNPFNWRS